MVAAEVPEQGHGGETFSSLAVPLECFDEPLHAQLFNRWLGDSELVSVQDAVLPVLEIMTPPQLLAFGQHIETTYTQTDRHEHVPSIWPTHGELSVDEAGLVTDSLGHISVVKDFFRNQQVSGQILDCLEEDVLTAVFFAAERWQGISFAEGHAEAVLAQEECRLQQRIKEQRLAALSDTSN